MTRKLIAWVAAIPLVILLTSALFCAVSSSTPVSVDEYAVYSSVLQTEFAWVLEDEYGTDWLPILVKEFTDRGTRFTPMAVLTLSGPAPDRFHSLPLSARLDFSAKSWSEARLGMNLDLPFPYEIRSGPVEGADFVRHVRFTRVGFDFRRTTALVYYEHVCGLCGEGKYLLLKKTGGTWRIVDAAWTWVS